MSTPMRMAGLGPQIEALGHRIIGAAIEVHRTLGPGFLESVYEEAIAHELSLANIRYKRQIPIKVSYKGIQVGNHRLDLLVEDTIIVELKAVDALGPVHKAQLISYLRTTNLRLGYIFNFNAPVLRNAMERIVL